MRKKVILTPIVLPEEVCGISDVELIEFLRFDIEGPPKQDGSGKKPVLALKFCGWCGVPYNAKSEVAITDVNIFEGGESPAGSEDQEDQGEKKDDPTSDGENEHDARFY